MNIKPHYDGAEIIFSEKLKINWEIIAYNQKIFINLQSIGFESVLPQHFYNLIMTKIVDNSIDTQLSNLMKNQY